MSVEFLMFSLRKSLSVMNWRGTKFCLLTNLKFKYSQPCPELALSTSINSVLACRRA